MKKQTNSLVWITVFSIAMAFLETSVVVYLRELLYPGGFSFPLAPMPGHLVFTEILREFATVVMLLGAGILTGRSFSQKFAWFIYSFAIWDIFYYGFLKMLINWPESLMTWDILFLIPTTWTGPVISPVIVSVTMICLALSIIYLSGITDNTRIDRTEWILLITGSLVIIFSFTLDYSRFILGHFSISELWTMPDKSKLYSTAISYIPQKFSWGIFISGELILVYTISRYFRRIRKLVKAG
jgi:hypothetical protein